MSIFVEAVYHENKIKINLESLLIIYVYNICDTNELTLKIVSREHLTEPLFTCDIFQIKNVHNCTLQNIPKVAEFCIWPVIVIGNDVIAGLCSVARRIIKGCHQEKIKSLLGFKNACLFACSEVSIWTKFCEIDMPTIVKDVVMNADNYIVNNNLFIPSELIKFERHMNQPVIMHNIYKIAREKNKDKSIKSSVPIKDLNLTHIYGEGLYMTLADILLYPCFKILFHIFGIGLLEKTLPLCIVWYNNLLHSDLPGFNFDIDVSNICDDKISNVSHEDMPNESLYTSDSTRYKYQNQIFTKQFDIENSFNIIHNSNIEIINDVLPFGYEIEFDWSKVPLAANPEGGALPKKRAGRKCEQLQSLAKAIIKIVGKHKYTIVDFCSGSGHLGILVATLLPNCEIILVENKENSLLRAKERIEKLLLKNVYVAQCNLDYFKAKFDLGTALHACGVATDLVLQNCIKNKAHFVCCPCCYGSIYDCYHLKYPRSSIFKHILPKKDYLNIAHAADQTHDDKNVKTKQGFFCMDVIDTDRKLMAESYDYNVHLGKLQPETCTPKNNLLVGVYKPC